MRVALRLLFTSSLMLHLSSATGQSDLNRESKLSPDEFEQLKKLRHEFIPLDLKSDTVLVIRYDAKRLEYLQRIARYTEFARNGEDTTGYTDELLFGKKYVEKELRRLKKESVRVPEQQLEKLKRRGVIAMIVDENALGSNVQYSNKYWLLTTYFCSQDRFKGPWISTMAFRFYDPSIRKHYEILRAINYDLVDFLD